MIFGGGWTMVDVGILEVISGSGGDDFRIGELTLRPTLPVGDGGVSGLIRGEQPKYLHGG